MPHCLSFGNDLQRDQQEVGPQSQSVLRSEVRSHLAEWIRSMADRDGVFGLRHSYIELPFHLLVPRYFRKADSRHVQC